MNQNRRKFISDSVKTLCSMGVAPQVISLLFQSSYNQAFASILDSPLVKNGIRYAHLSFPGAPPRWYFDLPLRPNGNTDPFIQGGFGTGLDITSTAINIAFNSFTYGNLKLPPVWGMNTSTQNFSEILPHIIFIRGMDMEIDSHGGSNGRQVAPILGGYSIHGVIADLGSNPMPAVVGGGGNSGVVFKSKKGHSGVPVDYTSNATRNPFRSLLLPFNNPNQNDHRAERILAATEQVHDQFDAFARQAGLSEHGLRMAHVNADEMMRSQVINLASGSSEIGWTNLVNKYTAILNEALKPNKGQLPGIFDKAITSKSTDSRFKFAVNDPDNFSITDLRDSITAETGIDNFAANFALLEFLFRTGLSTTLNLGFGGISRLWADAAKTRRINLNQDQHFVGVVPSILFSTLYFRAVTACLTECIDRFKQDDIFSKTILHIGSEFNRSPKSNGSGSDHGVRGAGTSIISGMINGTAVIGNVKADSENLTYKGTWGLAANWDFGNGESRPIRVADVARTITAMAGAKDIVNNGFSLLSPEGSGLWKPKKAGGKNVA